MKQFERDLQGVLGDISADDIDNRVVVLGPGDNRFSWF